MSKKYNIACISVEVGTMCNYNCRHCFLGKPLGDFHITQQVIDCFSDNLFHLGELILCGGDTFRYLDEIEMVLQTLNDRGIVLSYLRIITAPSEKSQRLIDIWDKWRKKTVHPEEAKLTLSCDKFHRERMPNMDDVVNWYREQITEGILEINECAETLGLTGNAENLSFDDIKDFDKVIIETYVPCFGVSPNVIDTCDLPYCPKDCLRDCIKNPPMSMGCDGTIFFGSIPPYADREKFGAGNITEKPLEEIIADWIKRCEKNRSGIWYIPVIDRKSVQWQAEKLNHEVREIENRLLACAINPDKAEYLQCCDELDTLYTDWNDFLKKNEVKECFQTIVIAEKSKQLKELATAIAQKSALGAFGSVFDGLIMQYIQNNTADFLTPYLSAKWEAFNSGDIKGYVRAFNKIREMINNSTVKDEVQKIVEQVKAEAEKNDV